MYYILSDELEKPKFDAYIDAALLNSKSLVTPNIFGKGKSILASKEIKFYLKIKDDESKIGKIRDRVSVLIHHSDHLFLASERLQELLTKEAENQVEFFQISFEYNGRGYSNHKIVNVLNKIECVNYEQSEITFEFYNNDDEGEGDIHAIESLVFDETLIPPHLNIFVLGRTSNSIIVVHERLKKEIEELSLSGFVFCLPEHFSM